MRHLRFAVHSVVAASILLLASATGAAADGWKIQLMGGRALASSYAGRSVLAEDASIVWFNPAGMTALPKRWTLTFAAPVITYQLDYLDDGSRSVLGQPLGGEHLKNGGMTTAVPHIYVVKGLRDRWWLGFGFNAPYGLGTDYGETWVGRYHATETMLTVFNLNPSIGVRISDALSLGFGLDIQRSQATLANMIDFGSIGSAVGLPMTPQAHDGRVRLKATDWAAGFNAGLRWEARPGTMLGAAYRSQVEHTVRGTAEFTVPSEAAPLTANGAIFSNTEATVVLPMPHELSVSASHDLNARVTLLGDVTWTRWSRFEALNVSFDNPLQPMVHQPASWRNAVRVAIGAKTPLTRRWSIRTGAAYEAVPVPAHTRTPRLPEAAHTWLSAGTSYSRGARWTFDAHLSHLITPDAPIALADATAGRLQGTVHWRLTVLGLSVTRRF